MQLTFDPSRGGLNEGGSDFHLCDTGYVLPLWTSVAAKHDLI